VINSFAPIDPALLDVKLPQHDGYPEHLARQDTPESVFAAAGETSREFPQELWIEPEFWSDKASDNDKYHTWGMNFLDRYTLQHPTHECTTHSLRANMEACRNRQRGLIFPDGPKKGFRYDESAKYGSVWLSPLSVYNEANPGQWGGANVVQVLEIAVKRGMLPDTMQPAEYDFKHALHGTTGEGNNNQDSGPWVPVARMPAGWKETAKLFKPLEIIFPGSWEEAVCLVLHGMLVSVGRDGHAVPWAMWNNKEKARAYPDSYDITRYDSLSTVKRAWRESFAVASMTAPDDWMKPAA
jgi:hypothetical protein